MPYSATIMGLGDAERIGQQAAHVVGVRPRASGP